MEHLFMIQRDTNQDALNAAFHNDTLSWQWDEATLTKDTIAPATPWLGFDHDPVPRVDLESYPKSLGWDIDLLWNGKLRDAHPASQILEGSEIGYQTAALIQSWFYLNFLEAIVDKKVTVSYLTRRVPAGEVCVDSTNLRWTLQVRMFQLRQLDIASKRKYYAEYTKCIKFVHGWVGRLESWEVERFYQKMEQDYPGFMKLMLTIIPSIIRLGEVLEGMFGDALKRVEPTGSPFWRYPIEAAQKRRNTAIKMGWCPLQVTILEYTTSQSALDWAIASGIALSFTGHERCTNVFCDRSNINTENYQQAHAHASCTCSTFETVKLEDIISSLADNKIPVIKAEKTNNGIVLSVSSAPLDNPGEYIAFSHVWADGLGSTTEEGLRTCQVNRLYEVATKISNNSTPHFWIDSMCVPANRKWRKKAILQMRQVYLRSQAVAVLDQGIRKCSSAMTLEHILIVIYTSAWMQRMWTYQEAVLARSLWFEFADVRAWQFAHNTHPAMPRSLYIVWKSVLAELMRIRHPPERMNVGHIFRAMRWRWTSRPDDEFVPAATLLGLPDAAAAEMLETKGGGAERARVFWRACGSLPADILFTNNPKLATPPFSWAPSTLMCSTLVKLDATDSSPRASVTESGLMGRYLAISLEQPARADRKSVLTVLVTARDTAIEDEQPDLFRVYATRNWPTAPDGWEFDVIALGAPDNSEPEDGQWVPGAALKKDCLEGQDSRSGSEIMCGYRGRVLVERLRRGEVSGGNSMMFAGVNSTDVDCTGTLGFDDLCVA